MINPIIEHVSNSLFLIRGEFFKKLLYLFSRQSSIRYGIKVKRNVARGTNSITIKMRIIISPPPGENNGKIQGAEKKHNIPI